MEPFEDTGQPYRLEHVGVDNVSANIPVEDFEPCAVIATAPNGDHFNLDGAVYDLTWSMEPVYVYTK